MMEYKTDIEMEQIRKYWGGSSMEWKIKDSAMDRPKPVEYVKLDDVIALFISDIDHIDADKKNIVGNGAIAQIQRTMADALRKHSSNMMDNVLNYLRRYEF